jgi:hypothetical protein
VVLEQTRTAARKNLLRGDEVADKEVCGRRRGDDDEVADEEATCVTPPGSVVARVAGVRGESREGRPPVGGGVGEGAPVNRDRVAYAGIARVAQGRWRRRRRGGSGACGIWSGRGRREGDFSAKSPTPLSNSARLGVRHYEA